jgi:hypothetical protein
MVDVKTLYPLTLTITCNIARLSRYVHSVRHEVDSDEEQEW